MNLVPIVLFIGIPLVLSFIVGGVFRYLPPVRRLKNRAKQWDAEHVNISDNPLTLKQFRNRENYGDKTVIAHYFIKMANEVEFKIRNTLWYTALVSAVVVLFVALITTPKSNASQVQSNTSPVAGSQLTSPPPTAPPATTNAKKRVKKTSAMKTKTNNGNSTAQQSVLTSQPNQSQNTNSSAVAAGQSTGTNPTTPTLLEGLQIVINQMPLFFLVPIGMFTLVMNSIFTFYSFLEQIAKFKHLFDDK